jgi:hypothetical protein
MAVVTPAPSVRTASALDVHPHSIAQTYSPRGELQFSDYIRSRMSYRINGDVESDGEMHEGVTGLRPLLCERITQRFPQTFRNGFGLTLRPDTVELPKHWRRPRIIFVNSMSDLFHVGVPDAFIHRVFAVMAERPQALWSSIGPGSFSFAPC